MKLASLLSARHSSGRAIRLMCLAPSTLIGLMLAASTALASAPLILSQDDVLRLTESGAILPFPQVLDSARHYQPGKLLEAALECENERYIYELDLLDHDGRIWELKFDAKTGEFLSKDEGN